MVVARGALDVEWLVILLSGGGATYAVWRLRALRLDRQERAQELDQARRIAEEDVTVFGEQLQRLDGEVGDRQLGPAARDAFQLALDIYERARSDAPGLGTREDVDRLVETLVDGRFAIACVRADVAGEPRPERRTPCFFNPQHGPSVTDVEATPRGHGTHSFPACRQCAARVRARQRPEIRMVRVGARSVPYWEAGTRTVLDDYGYAAAGQGTGPNISWIMDTAMQGDWDLGHYSDRKERRED